jgi:hypothetical protein
MSLDLTLPAHLVLALLPELVLTAWSVVLLLVVGWRHRTATDLRLAAWVSGVALATTGVVVWWLWWHRVGVEGLPSMIAVDDYRFVTDMIFLGTAAVTVLVAPQYLEREGLLIPEFFLLLVFATIGMMLMGGAADLMVLFLGLETMSVALYVMAALDRRSPRSAEAGLKYFLLGAFASGSCCMASPCCTGPPAPPISRSSARRWACSIWRGTRCSSPASASWWSASRSRSRPCRSTRGPRTCTTAHRRPSRDSWRRRSRPPPSPPCSACSSRRSPACQRRPT